MNIPSLALCIPAYNAARLLPRLLKTASSQTIPFDEILVYDDCSTDETGQVAQSLGAKVVRGEVNRGCSYGKNALAELSSCEWLHFHDADDALYPNFVAQARKWMSGDSIDVVLFGYNCFDDETEDFLGVRNFDDAALREDPISYAIREQINPFCGIYRRASFLEAGGFDLDPAVLYNEDVAMHCQLARAGLIFAADSTVTIINYRRSCSMSSSNQVKCSRAQFEVMKKASEALNGRYSIEISRQLWKIAGVSAAYLDWQTADSCVSLAYQLAGTQSLDGGLLFKMICKLHPYLAIRFREHLVRRIKPHLRTTEAYSRNF